MASITFQNLLKDTRQMEEQIESYDWEEAQATLNKLYSMGLSIIHQEVVGKTFSHIPLPVALSLVEILSNEKIQCEDSLRYTIIKTARVFIEIVLFKTHCHERKIYDLSRDNLISKMELVFSTLPRHEVLTEFEILCAMNATRAITAKTSPHRELALATGGSLVKGIAAASGGDVGSALGEIFSVIREAIRSCGKNMISKGYRQCWDWKWKVTLVKDAPSFQFHFAQDLTATIQKKGEREIYLVDVIGHIISQEGVAADFRERLISSMELGDVSLFQLAQKENKRVSMTRYLALRHLITLTASEDWKEACIAYLANQFAIAELPLIRKLLNQAWQTAPQSDQQMWLDKLKAIPIEEVQKKFREEFTQHIALLEEKRSEILQEVGMFPVIEEGDTSSGTEKSQQQLLNEAIQEELDKLRSLDLAKLEIESLLQLSW